MKQMILKMERAFHSGISISCFFVPQWMSASNSLLISMQYYMLYKVHLYGTNSVSSLFAKPSMQAIVLFCKTLIATDCTGNASIL